MKKYNMGFVIFCVIILSACSLGESVEKQLSETLSEMYVAEKIYRDAQIELSKLEKSEQELFIDVMELTQEQTVELEKKVSELEKFLVQRLSLIDKEATSMKKAQSLTKSLDLVIKNADEEDKSDIKNLKNAIANRYELHSTFIAEYKKLTGFQTELYEMLTNEAIELEELKGKVGEVNEQNEITQVAIYAFNESTETVNGLKEDLFAGFEEVE